ncbi:MAG TPA: hypothetical protein VFQ45_23380 [Longimicrobium sp.]|nr:hypothetical protein [Longimicrobium sp.]
MKRALLLGTFLLTAATLGACTSANPTAPDANVSTGGPAFNGVTFGSGNVDAPQDGTDTELAGGMTYGSGNADDAPNDSTARSGYTFGSGN